MALFTSSPLLPSGITGNVANYSFAQYEMQPMSLTDAMMTHMQEAPTQFAIQKYDLSNWFAEGQEEPGELTERELEIQQLRSSRHVRILEELQQEDQKPTEGIEGYLRRIGLRLDDLAYRRPKVLQAMGMGFTVGWMALLWYVPRLIAPRLAGA